MPLSLIGAKTNNQFVLVFDNSEEPVCYHTKHVVRMGGYTFVFCKGNQFPLAIYTGEEIKSEDDVAELVSALAEKYGIMSGAIESPFFAKLGEAILNLEDVSFEDVDEED